MPRRRKKSAKWGRLLHETARQLNVPDEDVDLDFVAVLAAAAMDVPIASTQGDKWRLLAKYRAHRAAQDALTRVRKAVVPFPSVSKGSGPISSIPSKNIPSKGAVVIAHPRQAGKKVQQEPQQGSTGSDEDFYKSPAWRRLRYRALVAHGNVCQCCGASPRKGFPLHVDHIRPRSKYPELALEFANLQVLCPDCNLGKSAWDETDWRE